MITKNEAREVFNLTPLPEPLGSQILARGEYYDIAAEADDGGDEE